MTGKGQRHRLCWRSLVLIGLYHEFLIIPIFRWNMRFNLLTVEPVVAAVIAIARGQLFAKTFNDRSYLLPSPFINSRGCE